MKQNTIDIVHVYFCYIDELFVPNASTVVCLLRSSGETSNTQYPSKTLDFSHSFFCRLAASSRPVEGYCKHTHSRTYTPCLYAEMSYVRLFACVPRENHGTQLLGLLTVVSRFALGRMLEHRHFFLGFTLPHCQTASFCV